MEIGLCYPERNWPSGSGESRKTHRRKLRGAVIVFLGMMLLLSGRKAYGAEVIHQSGMALQPYDTSIYDTVNNANETMTGYGHAYTNSRELNSVSGPSVQFRSLLYTEIPNPQSIAVSPDGKTAWVMSSYKSGSDNSRTGRIYRIDLSRFWKKKAAGSKDTGAIKAGPEIVTGHGQTLAYNPKSHELWYVRETKVLNTTLVRVNPKTMEVEKEIHFRFGSTIVFPPTFTFDKDGNCWTYTRSTGSNWVSAGTIRFYKGRIQENRVTFRMINQGLRYPPGNLCQTFGYNPVNDRLYVVADGEMLTVPAGKLSRHRVTPSDVQCIKFGGCREFEGLAFTETGCAYFATNKPSEIMRDRVSYNKALKLEAKYKRAKKNYARDRKAMKKEEEEQAQNITMEKIGKQLEDGL